MICVRRVYEPRSPQDGKRYLVERLWPRGMRKEALELDGWLKELAPSDTLRRWFQHDPAKWEEFKRRYYAELEHRSEHWLPLLQEAQAGTVTLLYSARDTQHNNAIALKEFLEQRLK
ncbi:hypothetical protein HRbin15_01888 [bacterium HR15]|nr:hypothetical protein HRbin15_01888 [bacterium HR15]